MKNKIQTVLGPVSAEELGGVLVHEHFVFGYPGYQGDASFDIWDEEEYMAEITPVVEQIKKSGIRTIVDATPNECGRDPELLQRISKRLGINIICATGYYFEKGGAPVYWNIRNKFIGTGAEEIYELMKYELKEGYKKTGIRAGVIKLATGVNEFSDYEKMCFTAACRLAKEDENVRIITHTSHGTMLKAQADFFLEQGVNPKQVQLGHFCDTVNLTDQMYCLEKGFYAAFDRFGQEVYDGMTTDPQRMAAIVGLVGAGFGDQILLSHDRVYRVLGRKIPFIPGFTDVFQKNWEWSFVPEKVIPTLREMGLSKEQTNKLLFENPARFLCGE